MSTLSKQQRFSADLNDLFYMLGKYGGALTFETFRVIV